MKCVESLCVGDGLLPSTSFLIEAVDNHPFYGHRTALSELGDYARLRVGPRRKQLRATHLQYTSNDVEVDQGPRIVVTVVRGEVGVSFAAFDAVAHDERASAARLCRNLVPPSPV